MDIVFPMLGFPEIAVGKCAIVQEIRATNFLQVKKGNLRLPMPTKFKANIWFSELPLISFTVLVLEIESNCSSSDLIKPL